MASTVSQLSLKVAPTHEVHFTSGPSLPHDARHEPARHHGVQWSIAPNAGGYPLGMVSEARDRDEFVLELRNLPQSQFDALSELLAAHRLHPLSTAGGTNPDGNRLIQISPLGSTSYAGSYLALTTLQDFRRVRAGRYEGRIHLTAQGSTL